MTGDSPRPPSLARLLLRIVLRQPGETTIWGDIEEGFTRRASANRISEARRWYWRQTLGSIGARVADRLRPRRATRDRARARTATPMRRFIETLAQDVRFAGRSLRRTAGFTAVAVLTIGLGIGATTTMYSLVNGILLAPLSYPDPERLVALGPDRWVSKPFFIGLRDATSSFEAIAGWAPRSHTVVDTEGAQRAWGPRVTSDFFDVLGPTVMLGRTFADQEDQGLGDAVVLSAGYWQRQFGRDSSIVGSTIHLSGVDRTVIGVMAPGYDFLQPKADVAVTQRMTSEAPGWGARELMLIGRLKPDVTFEQANADLSAVIEGWREQYDMRADWEADFRVKALRQHLIGDVRPTLLMLFGAVGILLLIATANVASLLAARGLSRRREVAVRLALGAAPRRLFRQLLTESTVLSVLGGFLGFVIAGAGIRSVVAMLPAETPRLVEVRVDHSALVFSLVVAVVIGWTIGMAPAIQSIRADLRASLQGGSRGGTESKLGSRVRAGLVTLEVALVVILLSGSGLLLKSFWRLTQVDLGFRADGLTTFGISPPGGTVTSHAQGQQFYRLIEERIAVIPGVTSVASTTNAPLAEDGWIVGLYPERRPPGPDEDPLVGRWRPVSFAYFETVGISLIRGRFLGDSDDLEHPQVGVLSESTARRLFGNDDPLGQTVMVNTTDRHAVTIVGVVGDVKTSGIDQESPPTIYRPFAQIEAATERFAIRYRDFVLRTESSASALGPLVRTAIRSVAPNTLVLDLRTMGMAISESMIRHRVRMILLLVFTAAALILGAVGVYGVIAYFVRERTRDIAIRVALGASRAKVQFGVVRRALVMASVGTLGGLIVTVMLADVFDGFVFGIEPTDTAVLASSTLVSLTVATVAAVAAVAPSLRASRIDVTVALAESA